MNLLIDFTWGIKNWKVEDEETREYQIILYDFGITISEKGLLWHSFETNNIDGIIEYLPSIVKGRNNEKFIVNDSSEKILRIFFHKHIAHLLYKFN